MDCAFRQLCVLGDSIVSANIPKLEGELPALKLKMITVRVIQSNLDFVDLKWFPILGGHRPGGCDRQFSNIGISCVDPVCK